MAFCVRLALMIMYSEVPEKAMCAKRAFIVWLILFIHGERNLPRSQDFKRWCIAALGIENLQHKYQFMLKTHLTTHAGNENFDPARMSHNNFFFQLHLSHQCYDFLLFFAFFSFSAFQILTPKYFWLCAIFCNLFVTPEQTKTSGLSGLCTLCHSFDIAIANGEKKEKSITCDAAAANRAYKWP